MKKSVEIFGISHITISDKTPEVGGFWRIDRRRVTARERERERERESARELVEKNCVANCWKLAPDRVPLALNFRIKDNALQRP